MLAKREIVSQITPQQRDLQQAGPLRLVDDHLRFRHSSSDAPRQRKSVPFLRHGYRLKMYTSASQARPPHKRKSFPMLRVPPPSQGDRQEPPGREAELTPPINVDGDAQSPLTPAYWLEQAHAEGLTLLLANNRTGYFCVHRPTKTGTFQATVRRGGKQLKLGRFATAEEAALIVARSPEGRLALVAAQRATAAPAPLTSEEVLQQAQAEGLTLKVAKNKTGYLGVALQTQANQCNPYGARVTIGGKTVYLGFFSTAEQAALCLARTPEGRRMKGRSPRRPSAARTDSGVTLSGRGHPEPWHTAMTKEQARQQAQEEGLTLLVADNKAGFFGVRLRPKRRGAALNPLQLGLQPNPFRALVRRGGKEVYLGTFATAEEAALCVARSPEGQVAAAARMPLTSGEEPQQATECRKRQRISDTLPRSHARSPSWLPPGDRPDRRLRRRRRRRRLRLRLHRARRHRCHLRRLLHPWRRCRACRRRRLHLRRRRRRARRRRARRHRRNSGVDDDAAEEVDEATAMVTVEVLDAVAVKDDDGHHHEAVVVEADFVSE